jgi:hypothetical protein
MLTTKNNFYWIGSCTVRTHYSYLTWVYGYAHTSKWFGLATFKLFDLLPFGAYRCSENRYHTYCYLIKVQEKICISLNDVTFLVASICFKIFKAVLLFRFSPLCPTCTTAVPLLSTVSHPLPLIFTAHIIVKKDFCYFTLI